MSKYTLRGWLVSCIIESTDNMKIFKEARRVKLYLPNPVVVRGKVVHELVIDIQDLKITQIKDEP